MAKQLPAASLPAKLVNFAQCTSSLLRTKKQPRSSCCSVMDKRARARRPGEPYLLSLPEDILSDIGNRLDDEGLCNMELTCRVLSSFLSRPYGTGPCGRVLHLTHHRLRALTPEASRLSS